MPKSQVKSDIGKIFSIIDFELEADERIAEYDVREAIKSTLPPTTTRILSQRSLGDRDHHYPFWKVYIYTRMSKGERSKRVADIWEALKTHKKDWEVSSVSFHSNGFPTKTSRWKLWPHDGESEEDAKKAEIEDWSYGEPTRFKQSRTCRLNGRTSDTSVP